MTKSLGQIQQENRKLILEAIYGCSYEEALKREVGFGCKILVKGKYRIYKNGKYECGEGLITMGTLEDENIDLEKNIIYTAKFDFEDIIEIIGKPITLNRVLLAFKNKGVKTLYKDRIIFNIEGSQFCGLQLEEEFYNPHFSLYGAGNWNLEIEELEEQSEETQRVINQLLTEFN